MNAEEVLCTYKDVVLFCKEHGVRKLKFFDFEAEFFESKPEPMSFDPVALSKALTDHMPSDDQMMFASTEEIEEPKE